MSAHKRNQTPQIADLCSVERSYNTTLHSAQSLSKPHITQPYSQSHTHEQVDAIIIHQSHATFPFARLHTACDFVKLYNIIFAHSYTTLAAQARTVRDAAGQVGQKQAYMQSMLQK